MKFYDKLGGIHTYLFMSLLVDRYNYMKVMKYIDLINIARGERLELTPLYSNKIFSNLEEYKKIYKVNLQNVILHKIIKHHFK